MDPVFPYNNSNVGPAILGQPNYPALITPSYFDDTGIIPVNAAGRPRKTGIGWNTQFPVGLTPAVAYDFNFNVKSLFYQIAVEFTLVNLAEIGFFDVETLNTSGIIQRFFVSSGTIFKYRFRSVNNGNINNKVTTDNVGIDFTKAFYDFRQPPHLRADYYWFPQFTFDIAGRSGYITNGVDDSYPLLFPNILMPSIPLGVVGNNPGLQIDAQFFAREVYTTERYDEIFFSPQLGPPGTQVTITCPPYKTGQFPDGLDSPGQRTGFVDVTEVLFAGANAVTNFTKLVNANGVTDRIQVTVPAGARTDVIKFKSVANQTNAANMTDYYATSTAFKVT
jgi:hypothetical protein